MNKRMTYEQINQLVNDLLKRRNHSVRQLLRSILIII